MRRTREAGAALVIGLVLLVILTLLAIAGMSTATTELVMAGNEQFRRNATQAATIGIEEAIAAIGTVPTVPGIAPTIIAANVTELPDVPDRYTTASRYVDVEIGLPQSSADKFIALHYEIESDGQSARNARDRQVQGLFIVAGAGAGGGDGGIGQIGTGLE